ncbi:MAG TPA: NAD(P)/FAD-dependent oxidoreductase [Chthoniobacteraceae bacterium]|nr:NAD(P)/FAD-dependent oxidoreductase [Chthoniobacteraceae bacterium]
MNPQNHYDAIVIGAGPAGSTAAALLAEKGRRVLVLEKEKFPRYHIGESMMPFCWFTLERLGVLGEIERIAYTKKYSVQFVTQDGRQSQPFYFFQHYDHPSSTTWQVERADFDLMLLENARRKGAQVREQTPVKRVLKDDGGRVIGVEAVDSAGQTFEVFAPMTIDCSGREQIATAREGWRMRDPQLNKLAIWTYYRGAKRDPGIDEGNTTVAYVPERGWFWYIPMRHDIVSVGVVAEKDYLFSETKDPAAIFAREIERNEWIKDHLSTGAQFGEYWVMSEFTYRAKYCATDGLVLAGDAFAFLDPVFSSGVFLALKSGELAADAVDAALAAGDVSGARFAEYGEQLCRGMENMRKLVYAFYDTDFSFGRVIKQYPHLRGRLTDCLIGDLFDQDYDELFGAISEFAELPAPLPHGRAPQAGVATTASAA